MRQESETQHTHPTPGRSPEHDAGASPVALQLQRKSQELEEAHRELMSFSYSVSHDLRTPLRHVEGFAKMLEDNLGDDLDETGRRCLGVIRDAIGRMGRMLDDLVAFSRLVRQDMRPTDVDLGGLVAAIREGQAQACEGRNVTWEIHALPHVTGDEGMLRLALTNLIGNALKFTSKRPEARIEVGGEIGQDGVRLYVRDNGAGFDGARAEGLFGVFKRMHRDEEFEGSGMGLAETRRIVLRHGGQIWAESAPDCGATFFIALPPPIQNPES